MKRAVVISVLTALTVAGCRADFGPKAQHGLTFYCPGVGNMDLGDAGIRAGLERAGYRGQVARVTWSLSFNPAIDQTVRLFAQIGAKRLAGYIQEYMDAYPGREVNLVGLSAGTGVAMWALESLRPEYRVNNVVFISSSLSHTYDAKRALQNVKGKIYNYCSPRDAVLAGPMKVFGSIDGVYMEDAAGAVGFRAPPGLEARVVNIPWNSQFERYGYYGGHYDGTSPDFVAAIIAPHIVNDVAQPPLHREPTRRVALALPGGHSD
jgi:pimeloyl-ACP methyl ester carboxylesterase